MRVWEGEAFGKAFASNPLARMRDRVESLETTYRANINTADGALVGTWKGMNQSGAKMPLKRNVVPVK